MILFAAFLYPLSAAVEERTGFGARRIEHDFFMRRLCIVFGSRAWHCVEFGEGVFGLRRIALGGQSQKTV